MLPTTRPVFRSASAYIQTEPAPKIIGASLLIRPQQLHSCSSSFDNAVQQRQQQCQHSSSNGRCSLLVPAAAGKGFGAPSKTKASSKGKRKCPCGSGQTYEACCQRYHSGSALAPTPEALLRSRFSGYALQEIDYLVKTTHRQNPEHTGNRKSYAKVVRSTAAGVEYLQLDIGGPVPLQDLPQAYLNKMSSSSSSSSSGGGGSGSGSNGGDAAAAEAEDDAFLRFSVKFRPRDGVGDQVANEISHFKRVDGEWLYYNEVDLEI